jgi:sigma-B regulation protein RsbU (phosphoserine phosphatase)
MYAAAPRMSAGEVLSAFHGDAPYLFLGAAFVAVGLMSAAFAVIRRKRDSLLIYFSLFAVFYGLRLWIHTTLLGITVQGSPFYTRLRSGIDYVPIIFGVLFFHSLGLLTRVDRMVAYVVAIVSAVLAFATFISGPSAIYRVQQRYCHSRTGRFGFTLRA